MATHKIVAIEIDDGNGIHEVLPVTNGGFDPQTEIDVEGHGGSAYQGVASIREHRPQATFTLRDLGDAITHLGVSGKSVDSDGDLESVTLWTVKRAAGAALDTTGTKISCTKGILVPNSLSAQHAGIATMDYVLHMGGGGSKPYSISTDAEIPSIEDLDLYTVGGDSDIQEISADWSPQIEFEQGGDQIYPQAVSVNRWEITATVQRHAPGAVDGPDDGAASTPTLTLSKRDATGIAATGALSMTFSGGITTLDGLQGGEDDDAMTTERITAISSDYEAFPISISA